MLVRIRARGVGAANASHRGACASNPCRRVAVGFQVKSELVERDGRIFQPISATVFCAGDQEVTGRLKNSDLCSVRLKNGLQTVDFLAPEAATQTKATFALVANGKILASQPLTQTPVRHRTIYILMHSHNDNGYTDLQPSIAKKQAYNIARALELIRYTKILSGRRAVQMES